MKCGDQIENIADGSEILDVPMAGGEWEAYYRNAGVGVNKIVRMLLTEEWKRMTKEFHFHDFCPMLNFTDHFYVYASDSDVIRELMEKELANVGMLGKKYECTIADGLGGVREELAGRGRRCFCCRVCAVP